MKTRQSLTTRPKMAVTVVFLLLLLSQDGGSSSFFSMMRKVEGFITNHHHNNNKNNLNHQHERQRLVRMALLSSTSSSSTTTEISSSSNNNKRNRVGVSQATARFAQTATDAAQVNGINDGLENNNTQEDDADMEQRAEPETTLPEEEGEDSSESDLEKELDPATPTISLSDLNSNKNTNNNNNNNGEEQRGGTRSARVQTQAFIDKAMQQQQQQQQNPSNSMTTMVEEEEQEQEDQETQQDQSSTFPNPLKQMQQQASQVFSSSQQQSSSSTSSQQRTFQSSFSSSQQTNNQEERLDMGDWELLHGNYLLRPKLQDGPPRALIHFLGGAIVGAAPHVSYRYILEELASEGYLIVATPFELSFDHLRTCDGILQQFEKVAPTLARTYGALPVVGVGHSTGALLQLLITSLFPDTPRAANCLISYNNRPISEAVPLFDEVFQPFFKYVVARNDTQRRNGAQVIAVALELAQAPARGQLLPRDELINKALRLWFLPQESQGGKGADSSSSSTPFGNLPFNVPFPPQVQIPSAVREAANAWSKAAQPTMQLAQQTGLLPPMLEILKALDQIPRIMEEVADGARDFVPSPDQVNAVAKRAYRARNTLVLQYTGDSFDQSEEMEALVRAAGKGLIRNKRPMLTQNADDLVKSIKLSGGHDTPLRAPPSLDVATRAEDILGPDLAREQVLQYRGAQETVKEICQWLEECNI